MKIKLAIVMLLLAVFLGFSYFHGKSIDRANLVNSASALMVAQEQLRQKAALTNVGAHCRIYPFTNRVAVGGRAFVCQLAADLPGLTNAGSLAAATDGTLIWIDKQGRASIVRDPDGRFMLPKRFHDF